MAARAHTQHTAQCAVRRRTLVQVGFIRAVVEPLFSSLAVFADTAMMTHLLAELRGNAEQWERKKQRSEKPLGPTKSTVV